MPMEFGLELMTVIGTDHLNTKRKLLNNVIYSIDCILLRMSFIHFYSFDAGGIVNRRILVSLDLEAVLALEYQKLNINSDMISRNLFVVTLSMDLTHASAAR